MTTLTFKQRQEKRFSRNQWIGLAALLGLLAAWFFGYLAQNTAADSYVEQLLPGAARVEQAAGVFTAYDAAGTLLGYAALGEAPGYAGPIRVLVGVDPQGEILGVLVIQQRETPGFYRQVDRFDFLDQFTGSAVDQRFVLGDDLDGLSGATLTAEAIARGVRQASRQIATQELGQSIPPEPEPVRFGWPEIALLAFFATGFIGHRLRNKKTQQTMRWASLVAGVIIIGFLFNKPLTVAHWTSLVAGYWPLWQHNLYWYLLIGGVAFVTLVDRKNPYCNWFCPFGGLQELIGTMSGAKVFRPRSLHEPLKWIQRGFAYGAVVLGLAFRQPGATSYEPFGALFGLKGSWPQFALLGMVLIASLVVMRPFCNYLCPVDPVVELLNTLRRWIDKTWLKPRKSSVRPEPGSGR